MSATEANKNLIRKFFQVVCNEHNFNNTAPFFHANFKSHRASGTVIGSENWLKGFSHAVSSFMPNFRADIRQMVAEGDHVWSLSHVTGIPNTPEAHHKLSVDMFRVQDSKILEHWDVQQDVDSNKCDI
ncbi:hypothetical protein MYAM1_003976 [Malassezia yamatoensis]|uniref:SnoaL-like domain-containing protein n=1 Tax=Malassezia yamatoensis TaxID=253288 RepID=A0AAJ5YXT7_9BASI|nr:hypothetical protein MYAM1_003976 [Malassezia yamatoensis]